MCTKMLKQRVGKYCTTYKEVIAILVGILLSVVVKVILGGLGERLFTTTNWTTGMYSVTVMLQALAKTSPYAFVR